MSAGVEINLQTAPFPLELQDMVSKLVYRPGWRARLVRDYERDPGCVGLTLIIITHGYNSRHPEQGPTYGVQHFFPVPPATYDYRSWRRWLLDCHIKVDIHEACEFFQIDGEFPYAPSHGPGNDPYLIRELGTVIDQRTRFTGEMNP